MDLKVEILRHDNFGTLTEDWIIDLQSELNVNTIFENLRTGSIYFIC